MATITKSIEIHATRDTIRQFYAHPQHTAKWSHILTVRGEIVTAHELGGIATLA